MPAPQHRPGIVGTSRNLRALRSLRSRRASPAWPDDEAGTPEVRAPRLLVRTAAGARAPLQLVLHALEHGLHVAARVDALDESDRIRLHDEIAALLARHGLAARSIRIAAPVARALPEERLK